MINYHKNFIIAGYLSNEKSFQINLFKSGISYKKARKSFNLGVNFKCQQDRAK